MYLTHISCLDYEKVDGKLPSINGSYSTSTLMQKYFNKKFLQQVEKLREGSEVYFTTGLFDSLQHVLQYKSV